MSRAAASVHLLDVNVLVALFDPAHIHHEAAHDWFEGVREDGWATCPLSENGFVRVVSNPGYPGRRTTVADAADRLHRMCGETRHVFWPDDVSLLDPDRVRASHLAGHGEVTDAYLLALCVAHDGALATFDRNIHLEAVKGAAARNVAAVPAGR